MTPKPTRKRRAVRQFFWDGKLHKLLRTNRPANLVEAWCYSDRRTVNILYTDFRRHHGVAYKPQDVAKLLNINRISIMRAIEDGEIREPERAYKFDGKFVPRNMFFSEKEILDLHDVFLSRHVGRPRKDGKNLPNQHLPSRAELIAKMRGDKTLYIQTDDGRMVPVFEEITW